MATEGGGKESEVRGVGKRAGESAPARVGDRECKKERAREGRKKVNSVCVLVRGSVKGEGNHQTERDS